MGFFLAREGSRGLWKGIGQRGLVRVEFDDVDALGGRMSSLNDHRVVGRSRLARVRSWARCRSLSLVEGPRRTGVLSVAV